MSNHNGQIKPRYLLGAALILLAIAMFLNNIGFGFIGAIFGLWPLALIVVGLMLLFAKDSATRVHGIAPYFLIGIGTLFLLVKLHLVNFSIGAIIVPLVLLFLGLKVLRPGNGRGRHAFNCFQDQQRNQSQADRNQSGQFQSETHRDNSHASENSSKRGAGNNQTPDTSGEKIDIFCLLSGADYSTHSLNLTGGNVVTILGGADIDIRDADTQAEQFVLDVTAIMGGVNLKVPAHWQVTINVVPFMGGIANKTTCLAERMNLPKKQLLITGTVVMGGIDVRN